MQNQKGFSYIESMFSLVVLVLFLGLLSHFYLQLMEHYSSHKNENGAKTKLIIYEQLIKQSFDKERVINIDSSSGVDFSLENGKRISFTPLTEGLVYETGTKKLLFEGVGLTYDATLKEVTLSSGGFSRQFVLLK